MRHTHDTLNDVQAESRTLIRAEIGAGAQRARLEQAVRIAVLHHRCSIDEVSEASGLTPKEVRELLERLPEENSEDLQRLAGAV